MKLSAREIDLISDIAKSRRQRRIGAWIGLGVLLASFVGVLYFKLDIGGLIPMLGVFSGMAISELANDYFGVRTQDRLQDLLLRYVNSDAEAIQEISRRSKSREVAA